MPERLVVLAAVVEREGTFLVTRRLDGSHLEGCWEFPGGKREAGESLHDCLRRELREELGVEVTPGEHLLTTEHAYPDRLVELNFVRCAIRGEPSARLGQEIRWVTAQGLRDLDFPPADRELIALLTGHLA